MKSSLNKIFSFVSFLLLAANMLCAQIQMHKDTLLMGSRFDITIVDKDSASAEKNIEKVISEISRIENLISEWRPDTQISEVNRNAGIRPVKVDKEVFELTKRALYFSKMTDGAFDISIAAMDRIWKFDGSMEEMPSVEAIKKSIEKVGYQNIELDSIHSTIFLKLPGMKIGFGATGKGYAAEKGKQLMLSLGINSGIVNASGDMAVWGTQSDGKPWKIGIVSPFKSGEILKVLSSKDSTSVVTSGDYQRFVEFDGKYYSHIINPKTGFPANGLRSVTVIGPNAETANGISTSIMVLGKEKGLKFIKKFPDYSCLLITDKDNVICTDIQNILKHKNRHKKTKTSK